MLGKVMMLEQALTVTPHRIQMTLAASDQQEHLASMVIALDGLTMENVGYM